jgi:hypothetical protein
MVRQIMTLHEPDVENQPCRNRPLMRLILALMLAAFSPVLVVRSRFSGAPRFQPLRTPVPHLTGAACKDGALEVDLPNDKREGLRDPLTLGGDYHGFD